MKRITIIFAHPKLEQSRANKKILEKITDLNNVNIKNLYKEYPDFQIDVKKEQELLIESDLIIFQFPFYWYSSPSLLKEWEDKVLEHGFAYGSTGKALHGKDFCVFVTIGGPQESYSSEGYNSFQMTEFLKPFHQTANLCGMNYLPPVIVHGVPNIPGLDMSAVPGLKAKEIDERIENYAQLVSDFLINY